MVLTLIITVVGCADLVPGDRAWFRRTPTSPMATVGCSDSDATWHLICQDNKWIGSPVNCSASKSKMDKHNSINKCEN